MDRSTDAPARGVRRNRIIRLIALFKFCKVALLITVAGGAIGLTRPKFFEQAHGWADALAINYHGPLVEQLIAAAEDLTPHRLELLAAAAFFFAALFLTEGLGLWFEKRWAEYMTVIATLSLVPFELYELTRRTTLLRFAALALNVAAAAYLIYRLRTRSEETAA